MPQVPAAWHTRDREDVERAYNRSQEPWDIPADFWAALASVTRDLAPAGKPPQRAGTARFWPNQSLSPVSPCVSCLARSRVLVWSSLSLSFGGCTHSGTRFAAVTMPLENIYCTRSDAKATRLRDDSRSVRERIRNGTARACREHTCCRRAMVAARNELVGLPTSWLRLEFAALTRAAPPLDSLGWHYQCQLSPPHTKSEAGIRCARPRARASCLGCCAVCGLCHEYCARACVCVRRFVHGWMAHVCVPAPHARTRMRRLSDARSECAEQAMRLKYSVCNRRYAKWYASGASPSIVVRQPSSNCSEDGNTRLWRHVVASVSTELFPRREYRAGRAPVRVVE